MTKLKIGIYGSAADERGEVIAKAVELGKVLGQYKDKIILITGASAGIPHVIVNEASKYGVEIWGYSPEIDLDSQKKTFPACDVSIFSKILYVPREFEFVQNASVRKKYRNVLSTANGDAGIIVSGRWGTLNEFTNLTDMGKVVGVYTGTGGVADEIERLTEIIQKPKTGKVLFSDSPEKLMVKLLAEMY
ncbi:MAG TPA: hypothetical protein VJL83_03435 [Patescibacteria group bacterium]|nr:hypothetical protein [Patescibacteria group bacterium]